MSHPDLQETYRGFRKNKSGYTLIELCVTIAIILILSSIAIFAYQSVLASARKTVCKTNLNALGTAIENFVLENDALPATLGRLKLKHLEKGYAIAMEDRGWVTEISLFLIKLDESDNAYAQYLTYENLKSYGVTEGIFGCPSAGNPGASYAINGELEGKRWSEVDKDDLIVADSDNHVFTSLDQLAQRHDHQALAITMAGQIVELSGAGDDYETICHKPGTPAEKTMTKSGSALEDHLAHGDTVGACP